MNSNLSICLNFPKSGVKFLELSVYVYHIFLIPFDSRLKHKKIAFGEKRCSLDLRKSLFVSKILIMLIFLKNVSNLN